MAHIQPLNRRSPVRHRHLIVNLQRLKPKQFHPRRILFFTGDLLDNRLGQSLIDLVSIPFLILHIVYAAVSVFYVCLLFHRSSSPFFASFSYSS